MAGASANRHHGSGEAASIDLARFEPITEALGPGRRSLVMVQGCQLRCKGCLVPSTHPTGVGPSVAVEDLAEQILAAGGDGLTLSGGEPMLQARALSALIDRLRECRPGLSVLSYSGYRIERLFRAGSAEQLGLLDRLDVLIDGPYVERWHKPLRWRASTNQRVLLLSARHRRSDLGPDLPVPLEMRIDPELGLTFVGVPPVPGFLADFDSEDEEPGPVTA